MAPFYSPGKYLVAVVDQGWQKSKKDNEMLVLKVRVDAEMIESYDGSGQLVQEQGAVPQNYTRTIRLTITENNLDKVVDKLRYAGFEGERWDEVNLVGQHVYAFCDHQLYNNQPSENWDLALPPRTTAPIESDSDVPKRLNALFGKALKRTSAASAPPVSRMAAPVSTGPDYDDDDIPF